MKPTKLFNIVSNKPNMTVIASNKPNLKMFNTRAVVGVGGWTYNQTGLQYNATGTLYGGSDRRADLGPNISSITTI